ncbi:YicC family protein [Gammaproteobacteria bacterium]|nr:YicC family protein [Gammaproteobacteria bacterium]MDA8720057.1 YicC family protein [bacterium]MDA9341255.1 YicC family protein [Gammaproteobacteria bacterium]MDB4210387.1 YicC family protein [Gammaproteobacteria bacterium]MDB9700177.1 YicC family protein [Gammaproteobacteria bacterium]
MFYSMTGYGNGTATLRDLEVLCEIKSVNNRFIEITFRGYSLPNEFEEHIKTQIKKFFLRGSFEVKINDNFQSEHSYKINHKSLQNLKDSIHSTKDFQGNDLRLSDLKDIPGLLVVTTSKKDISTLGKKALNLALKNLADSRAAEGTKIEKIVFNKLAFLSKAHMRLSRSAPSLLQHRLKSIKKKLVQKNINLRKDDLSSEISTLALKHDIAEELERISFHMDSLKKLLKLKSAHGKKMDFILQELFREVNTLSVKIEKPDLKDLALTMKLKVEELREQAQNLE